MADRRLTPAEVAAANYHPYPTAEIAPPNPNVPVRESSQHPPRETGMNELPCGHPLTNKVMSLEGTAYHCTACEAARVVP